MKDKKPGPDISQRITRLLDKRQPLTRDETHRLKTELKLVQIIFGDGDVRPHLIGDPLEVMVPDELLRNYSR